MVKKYKQLGLGLSEFTRLEQVNRLTFKDWVTLIITYKGEFIRIDNLDPKLGALMGEDDMKVSLLKDDEITKKSAHFTRFDHSMDACPSCEHALSLASEKVRYVVESIPATLKVTKIINKAVNAAYVILRIIKFTILFQRLYFQVAS